MWRHEAFLKDDGYSVEDSLQQLISLTSQSGIEEVALLARYDGAPAGICMLVRDELDPAHKLTPWLASLYVVPDFRNKGVAHRLVRAIEDQARSNGVRRLQLYTYEAKDYYLKCGWNVTEQFDWHGSPSILMQKNLE